MEQQLLAKPTTYGSVLSEYEIMGQLGRGATAFVYQVRCRNTQQIYALKVVDKENLRSKNLTGRIRQEIEVHRQLKCPYIVELHHFFEDEQNVYLLMEHCPGQELYQYVRQEQAKGLRKLQQQLAQTGSPSLPASAAQSSYIEEREIAEYVRQLAIGIEFMQSRGIMHRDMKLSNILLTETNQMKIIDFGLAVQLSDLTEERETLCGTPNYISPEVIQNKPYGLSTDLWSLGCIMYALMTGKPPFECATVQDTLLRIKSGKFVIPDQFSQEAADLIGKLLTHDPSVRTSITDVLGHPFICKHNSKVGEQEKDGTEGSSQMLLADLHLETPAGARGGDDIDTMLGFQTLGEDTEDRKTNRQSTLESADRHAHCEETPGFKRAGGQHQLDSNRDSLQSSSLRASYDQNPMTSTLRKSDAYKRKSSQGPPAAGATGNNPLQSSSFKRVQSFSKQTTSPAEKTGPKTDQVSEKLESLRASIEHKISSIRDSVERNQSSANGTTPSSFSLPSSYKGTQPGATSSVSPALLDNARQVAHKVVTDEPQTKYDLDMSDLDCTDIKLPIEAQKRQPASALPTSLFEDIDSHNPIDDDQVGERPEPMQPAITQVEQYYRNFNMPKQQPSVPKLALEKTKSYEERQALRQSGKQIAQSLKKPSDQAPSQSCQQLVPVNTKLVRPFRHQLPNSAPESYIQVTDKGWVSMFLAKQNKKIQISPDGQRVFIDNLNNHKLEYRPFAEQESGEAKFPSKLKPWYSYAFKFVDTIRTKSPKVVVRQSLAKCKVNCVLMLSGLIEVTLKSKNESGETDIIQVIVEGPKYDLFQLEQDVHGLKQTLEINVPHDFEHLDPRLQFFIKTAREALELCLQYDRRATETGTVSDHSQLPLVYKLLK